MYSVIDACNWTTAQDDSDDLSSEDSSDGESSDGSSGDGDDDMSVSNGADNAPPLVAVSLEVTGA